MASGSHLVIPHLDGIPTEHRFHAGGRASIRLAQTSLEVDIADPTDWRRVRHDPTAYVEATLNRWIDLHGGKTIRRRFNLRLTLSELVDEYADAAEQDPDGRRLYLILYPDSAAYVVAGATLELLEREHGRLPATFYHVFTGALNKWLRIYDFCCRQQKSYFVVIPVMWRSDTDATAGIAFRRPERHITNPGLKTPEEGHELFVLSPPPCRFRSSGFAVCDGFRFRLQINRGIDVCRVD